MSFLVKLLLVVGFTSFFEVGDDIDWLEVISGLVALAFFLSISWATGSSGCMGKRGS
jgi:hypothetical protein